MKNIYKLLFFFLLLSNFSFGYDQLYIVDPRGWRSGQGTIEEAVFSIIPKGTYAEINTYLTFSAKGLGFNHNDSLEIQFTFDLPSEAIVSDLWLWINKQTIQFVWDGLNNYGESVSSGIYFFAVTTPNARQSFKLLMLK